jgi:hypothetical protein
MYCGVCKQHYFCHELLFFENLAFFKTGFILKFSIKQYIKKCSAEKGSASNLRLNFFIDKNSLVEVADGKILFFL